MKSFLASLVLVALSVPALAAEEIQVCAVYAGPEYPHGLPVGEKCRTTHIEGKSQIAQRVERAGFRDAYKDADGRVWGVVDRRLRTWKSADAKCASLGARLPTIQEIERMLELQLTEYLLPGDLYLWSSWYDGFVVFLLGIPFYDQYAC
jgi:hypothetical protein